MVWGNNNIISFCILTYSIVLLLAFSQSVLGRPATFVEDFKITWADSHVKQIQGGRSIQLILDQNSGCGFASKRKYLFGKVSMRIKLISGDSAGTVTAFYVIAYVFVLYFIVVGFKDLISIVH